MAHYTSDDSLGCWQYAIADVMGPRVIFFTSSPADSSRYTAYTSMISSPEIEHRHYKLMKYSYGSIFGFVVVYTTVVSVSAKICHFGVGSGRG